jgi:NTE family protein
MKTGLVLSGGSIKGAFQAGAIREILDAGVKPAGIYGISVGSLNGGFLTDRAGQAGRKGETPDWPAIGEELGRLWLETINSFGKIGKKRGSLKLVWNLLWSKFDGLIDTGKLQALVNEILDEDNLRESPAIFKAGSVNVADGTLFEADNRTPNLIKYIIASTAIPVVMPVSKISGQPLVDGGVRDVAAMKPAIEDGAEEIVCVLCQPRDLAGAQINTGNLMHFAERLMDIIINETVNNDIEWAQFINDHTPEDGTVVLSGSMQGYRRVPLTVIRPSGPLDINLTDFSRVDIERIYEEGRAAAKPELQKRADRMRTASPV